MTRATTDIDFIVHDYRDNDWIGIIVNIDDPTFSGRAQIRTFGLMDNIIDKHLPWFTPINSTIFSGDGAGSLSVPKIGQIVRVQFNNGDIQAGEYTTIQNIDTQLIDKIKEDYPGTHVLLFDPDENLNIIYQKNTGLMIFLKDSYFSISSDSLITIQTPDNKSIIQLEDDVTRIVTQKDVEITASQKVTVSAEECIIQGNTVSKIGNAPYFSAILAEPMWGLLQSLGSMIDTKYPSTPGVAVSLIESVKQSATSTNVKIGS